MPKLRFGSLDVRATVATLQQTIVGLRLQNVYDVNSRTYLFKFSKPDRKEMVLIESGIRMHTTLFLRDKSITPSGFCIKIRKHLRTRRLTGVKQLGSDRIVDFEFGADDLNNTYHIIAEFYAAGNLILTDGHYKILSILRVVQPNEKVRMAVGETYDIGALTRSFEPIQKEHLVEVLKSAGPKDILKKILNTKLFYGPALTEHAILKAGLTPNTTVATGFDTSEGSPQIQALFEALQAADSIIEKGGDDEKKGYIIMLKHKKKNEDDPNEQELVTYDEFHPYLFLQHELQVHKEFESFDAAVDEFFSAIESQRLELKKRAQEEHAQKKLDSVRMEHFGRVRGLEEAQQMNVMRAELIEANLEMCDQAIMIIRNAVATGMDWKDLADLVDEEKRHGNPIALMIDSLKLESNNVCVVLSDPYDEEEEKQDQDEDQEDQEAEDRHQPKAKPTVLIDLDIYLTAFANARKYYDVKKQSAIKQEKTLAHASKAFKSAEKKIRQQLQEVKITTSIQRARKPYWFEKFMWFITSENYLVIAGRDAQQNEMIVKRYMKKNDIYVHADIHGAATVLIKNPSDKDPVPPSSIYQAGIMSVCQSKAWDAKIVTSAYWVRADQVSKSAPTGEYLTTGSFMIRGKKNFLPPVQLVYGFGLLFKLDDSSIANHLNERHAPRIEDAESPAATANLETATSKAHDDEVPSAATPAEDKEEQEEQEEHGLGGSDDSDSEKESNEDRSAVSRDGDDDASLEDSKDESQTQSQDDDNGKSDSEDESEAAESSDEEFPDTQIQFNTNAMNTNKKQQQQQQQQQAMAGPAIDKYGLQDYGDDSNEELEKNDDTSSLASSDRPQQGKSSYITAKMRRDMKKGRTPGQSEDIGESSQAAQKETQPKKQQQADKKKGAVAAAPPPPPPTSVRGKRGKAKKIKEKYADQDEEERQLRLELLAPDKGPQLKGKRAKKEAEKKAEKAALTEKRRVQQDEYQKGQTAKDRNKGGKKAPHNGKIPDAATNGDTEDAVQGDADAAVPLLDENANEDEREEVRRLLQEENIKMLEPEESENLTVLDGLTGRPLPTDILQFAVPVCAPYSALQKYKYKVKLIPGTMKKGKAVKTAMNHFLTAVNSNSSSSASESSETKTVNGLSGQELRAAETALEARERELIKMVKDEEAINAMIGKSKVSAPGVEASKKKSGGSKGRK
ncbi:fibronectin-binding protein A N-terminus-domain-containing protein [Gamsiella multidivaricata]|uniref:fibronectin-binding protein A N-terminus-domain-containing protein n=1 Tax=Gamsiella multidivaricata TaxID=101098 RepID=UPI0022206F03|nr:fibronectin-binding protein A N-terminus-domain-containing protein [Gamsiella multidivaricata]KAI7818715.1 fibronectin-binding protein A N-terminus-domain-containing protein [Gamsiella multidivaricata]